MKAQGALIAVLLVVVVVVIFLLGSPPTAEPVNLPTLAPASADSSCPPEGRGGDPILNALKNRTQEPATYQRVTTAEMLGWAWPRSAERKDYERFGPQDRTIINQFNSRGVVMEGYLLQVQLQGPESANCDVARSTDEDYHIWIVGSSLEDRSTSVVVEVSPRVRKTHPELSIANLQQLVGKKVRVYGWVMFDPEHPDQVGKTRGTLWEIHPIFRIEEVR